MQLAGWQNTKAASSYSCFLVNESTTIGAGLCDQEEIPHYSSVSRPLKCAQHYKTSALHSTFL